jgi:outer membrane protein, heavy metal efflux system
VIELGGKRGARTALADARSDQVQLEISAQTLELIGTTTEQFVTALAAQARLDLARDAVSLDQATLNSLQQRARAGAASDADVHRAQAALARTRLGLEQQSVELQIARVRLAALWGEPGNPPDVLSGDLFALSKADDFALLYARARGSPALNTFTQEERLQQLNAQLARVSTRTDLHWNLGLRHLAGSDDNALVAGVSVPLFSQGRGRGERLQAEARLGEAQAQRQQAEVNLHAELFETYTRREQAVTAALLLRGQLIPALEQAFALSRQAFERGRYSYLDLMAVQRELLEARSESIDSATTALILGAVLEQLTAAPLSGPQSISASP